MTSEQTTLVANELKSMGFDVTAFSHFILVFPFFGRPLTTMEVETALEQKFEGIEFSLSKSLGKVKIK